MDMAWSKRCYSVRLRQRQHAMPGLVARWRSVASLSKNSIKRYAGAAGVVGRVGAVTGRKIEKPRSEPLGCQLSSTSANVFSISSHRSGVVAKNKLQKKDRQILLGSACRE